MKTKIAGLEIVDELAEALLLCERAMNAQVQMCHDRHAHFMDPKAWSRPMDYQQLVAEMYGLTAEPLAKARAALEKAGLR